MDYYDAHIHVFDFDFMERTRMEYTSLEGFSGGCFIVFEELPDRWDQVLMMVPPQYHKLLNREKLYFTKELFEWFSTLEGISVIPYLDTRFFLSGHVKNIKKYADAGYGGVKIIYLPEKDEFLKVDGWEQTFGRSVKASEQVTSDIVAQCHRLALPVLIHLDLRQYGDFMDELLSAYPDVNFNVPHFGSSRKKMADFFKRYPNCFSDFSSLLPLMKKAPGAYAEFMIEFSDQILLGSDDVTGCPSALGEYVDYVRTLVDESVFKKVIQENYLRFHRIMTF